MKFRKIYNNIPTYKVLFLALFGIVKIMWMDHQELIGFTSLVMVIMIPLSAIIIYLGSLVEISPLALFPCLFLIWVLWFHDYLNRHWEDCVYCEGGQKHPTD